MSFGHESPSITASVGGHPSPSSAMRKIAGSGFDTPTVLGCDQHVDHRREAAVAQFVLLLFEKIVGDDRDAHVRPERRQHLERAVDRAPGREVRLTVRRRRRAHAARAPAASDAANSRRNRASRASSTVRVAGQDLDVQFLEYPRVGLLEGYVVKVQKWLPDCPIRKPVIN